MIITLIGADFSKNNIGTLTTWSIGYSTNISASVTADSNNPSSVDRTTNTGFTAIYTINDGYELSSTGVTVTMGGVVQDNVVTIEGSKITVTFTSVTGNVNISINTKVISSTEPDTPTNYTFTINPDPTSATVTLSATGYSTVSGTGNQSITVANGTTINWSVSASGYTTRTGNWTVNGGNKTENIALTATGGSGGQITNTYNLPSFVMQTTGQLATNSNTWIHSDFIPVNDLSNSTEDGKCVRTFVSHGSVAAIAFYSQPNFDSYVEGFILTNTAGKSETQTAEQVKACITKDNANYVVFSTDGSKATLSVTTGEGSTVTPEPEEPENPGTGTSGINYYEEPGYINISSGQVTNTSSSWIHSDFIPISELEDDASLGHCIGKFTGHSQVADIAFYSSNSFSSFIAGKSSAGATKTVTALQNLMTELNVTGATYIVISTDKSKNQLYANLK